MGLTDESRVAQMVLSYKNIPPQGPSHSTQEKYRSAFWLKVYMEALPEWLKPTDAEGSNNWMDIDNKMTETISLLRYLAQEHRMFPKTKELFMKCEKLEKELFQIMVKMGYTINKICYAPNSGPFDSWHPTYSVTRFSPRCISRLPDFENQIQGPFILGEDLVYTDFLLYACLHDLKVFVPKCFDDSKYPKIAAFLDGFEAHPAMSAWFGGVDPKEAYIRPPFPNVHTLLVME